MTDPSTIRAVCAKLDPGNDAHWTSQGLPRMDVLEGFGLKLERRELNDALPGFNRAKAAEARADAAATEPTLQAIEEAPEQGPPAFFLHAKARAARRQAALAHLAAGGFTAKDLEPVRCRLDRSIGARNRQARREMS